MPNWCHNKLYVGGDTADLARFMDAVKTDEQPLSFERILPTPAGMLDDTGGKGVLPDWYSWRCDHWGTKWDASFENSAVIALDDEGADPDASPRGVNHVDDQVLYQFDTAWAPPVGVVKAIAEQYPDLRIMLEYGEPGMEFAGRWKYADGDWDHEDVPIREVLDETEMWF